MRRPWLVLSPLLLFFVRRPGVFVARCFSVLLGRLSWVGYARGVPIGHLPPIREGVMPPCNILPGYEPADRVKDNINTEYARQYSAGTDISLVARNFRYLGL